MLIKISPRYYEKLQLKRQLPFVSESPSFTVPILS